MDLRKDVLYYDALVDFPSIGQENKLYLDKSNGALYYWNGSSYALSGDGKGNVLSVTASAPLASSGGANPNITLSVPSDNTKFLDGTGAFDTVKDSDLSLSDITTNDVSTSKHGFAPKAPNDTTKFLRGDGTWAVPAAGSSSGKFGIADSTGAYTYYTTLSAAMTAAVSGQTIEFFTDYTETGAVTITLKDGVNINGNGHTYIMTYSASGLSMFLNDSGTQTISNLTIFGNGVNSSTNGFIITYTAKKTFFDGVVIKMTAGVGCYLYGVSVVDGLVCNVSSNAKGFYIDSGSIYNCKAFSANNYAIQSTNGGNIYNSYANSISASAMYLNSSPAFNSTGIGPTGIECQGGSVYNCVGISNSGYGIYLQPAGVPSKVANCTAISTASWGIFAYSNYTTIVNSTIISTASYGIYSQFTSGSKMSNNYVISSANSAIRLNSSNFEIYNNHIDCTWNNAGGHAFQAGQSGDILCGNVFQVANASANCLNAASAVTTKYADSKFIGATTPVNANITQGMVNTEDNFGNILI